MLPPQKNSFASVHYDARGEGLKIEFLQHQLPHQIASMGTKNLTFPINKVNKEVLRVVYT